MSFEENRHLISAEQVTEPIFEKILKEAEWLDLWPERQKVALAIQEENDGVVTGLAISDEPSSRTIYSFINAAEDLGFLMLPITSPNETLSIGKGEPIVDTFMTFSAIDYNIIAYRSKDESAIAKATRRCGNTIIINAGSGKANHPTQAIGDAITFKNEFGSLQDLSIAHIGDPWNSRTVRSQVDIFRPYGAHHIFFSIPELRDEEYEEELRQKNIPFEVVPNVSEAAELANVIDVVRFQKARQPKLPGEDDGAYKDRIKEWETRFLATSTVDEQVLGIIEKNGAIITHALPRNFELPESLTDHPQVRIKEQMKNCMRGRRGTMALLLTRQLVLPRLVELTQAA
jgi:aspartate carbamoyltransferase catalytic subunit